LINLGINVFKYELQSYNYKQFIVTRTIICIMCDGSHFEHLL